MLDKLYIHYLPVDIAANMKIITNGNFILPQIHRSVEVWLKRSASSSETAPTF